jgi:Rieske Fe-S protein
VDRRRFLVTACGACVACSSSSSAPDNTADASPGDAASPHDSGAPDTSTPDTSTPPFDSGNGCVTPGTGPGVGQCGVPKKQVRVANGAKLAAGQVVIVAMDPSNGAIVARDAKGFYAMSSACTHACCSVGVCSDASCVQGSVLDDVCVSPPPSALNPSGSAFVCPCHGSEFAADGSVTRGPAAMRLNAVKMSIDGNDVLVDVSQAEDPATRVTS